MSEVNTNQTEGIEQAMVSRVSKNELVRWMEESALPYRELMVCCRCASRKVADRLEICGEELMLQTGGSAVESVRTGLKTPESIVDAMVSGGLPLTAESVERNLDDLTYVEAVCAFPGDVYALADALLTGPEAFSLVRREDFIASPGENGYRGLHLVVSVPVTLRRERREIRVKVILLTPAMELWVNTERKFLGEKERFLPEQIAEELRECSALSAEWDQRMEQIRYNLLHHVITK